MSTECDLNFARMYNVDDHDDDVNGDSNVNFHRQNRMLLGSNLKI